MQQITERCWAQGAASAAGDAVSVGELSRKLLPMALSPFMRGLAAPVQETS